MNARIRDAVWNRVCENIKNGKASMAFSASGEQKLDFRIHNTEWEPVDHDGIKLVRRDFPSDDDKQYKESSKINIRHINRLSQIKNKSSDEYKRYIVIDIETTGIKENYQIIEVGAIKINDGSITDSFSTLVQCTCPIPEEISKLTGIVSNDLNQNGAIPHTAIGEFLKFCGNDILIGHNIEFDIRSLQKMSRNNGSPLIKNRLVDTMLLSRKKLNNISRYSLSAVAEYLEIEYEATHRAINDCILTYRIFDKLKEL